MWHSILIVFVALAIAGLVADLINTIGKAVIWLGMVISRQHSVTVDFTWNIIIGFTLSLYVALFFLL
jgi:hypothetical protein